MNGHIGLIHSILPATVDLHVTIPETHASARNLGSERAGSGAIIAPDGYILTVHYVTVGASSITVTTTDGEQFPGKIAAQDQETGLALVKIPGHDLPFLRLAPPNSANLGDPVVMIASAGQSGRRIAGGYISSTESYDGQWEYMIDKTIRVTAFNPGFGGGALANFRGELVGIVSLNLNEVGKFTLAIPVDYYRTYEQELKQYGQVRSRPSRPWLGLYSNPLAGHVVISGVVPGGPAAKHGLREGDIILSVEQKDIRSRSELYHEMWKKRPGSGSCLRFSEKNSLLSWKSSAATAPTVTDPNPIYPSVESVSQSVDRSPLNWVQIVQAVQNVRNRLNLLNGAKRPLIIPADFFHLALAHDFDRQRRRIGLRLIIDESLIGFLQIS